ncbi:MAG: GNAT family N-acetyltransferase [Planctomycetota bacterium]
MSSQPPQPPETLPVAVRSFDPRDHPDVVRLYDVGLLAGQLAPNDTGADIDNIAEAYFDDERHHFWVAEGEGRVLGMIGVASDDRDTAEVRRLRVEPGKAADQVALPLLEASLEHCRKHGYLKVRLDTRFDSEQAVDLFERLGFQHTRTRNTPGKATLEFYFDLYRDREPEGGQG